MLSPEDSAALTYDFASYLVTCSKAGLAPGDQGWWDDGCAHLEPWGFSLDAIRIPVQLWHGAKDQFVPFQHGQSGSRSTSRASTRTSPQRTAT